MASITKKNMGNTARQPKCKAAGFSLIELTIIMVIVGLVATSALQTYRIYKQQTDVAKTDTNRSTVKKALEKFIYENKRFPCPADPKINPTVTPATAGVENCLGGPGGSNTCSGGICRIDGSQDTEDDTDSVIDHVLTGSIPFATLGVSPRDAQDAWGNKLFYAVTEYLTVAPPSGKEVADAGDKAFNLKYGAIDLKKYDTRSIADGGCPASGGYVCSFTDDSTIPLGRMAYIMFSFGPDGMGAYNYYGKQAKACTGTGREVENCNGDFRFWWSADGNDPTNVKSTNSSTTAAKALYFDDTAMTRDVSLDQDTWTAVTGSSNIYNKPLGSIGIGTQTPTTALDVAGDIKAPNFWSPAFCKSSDSTMCIRPETFFGNSSGVNCNGAAIIGIRNGAAVCGTVLKASAYTSSSCASGKYATGINSAGQLVCN